jgi:hypothetical protein
MHMFGPRALESHGPDDTTFLKKPKCYQEKENELVSQKEV